MKNLLGVILHGILHRRTDVIATVLLMGEVSILATEVVKIVFFTSVRRDNATVVRLRFPPIRQPLMTCRTLTEALEAMPDTTCPASDRVAAIQLVSESSLDATTKEHLLLACLDDRDVVIKEAAITGIGIADLRSDMIAQRLTHFVYNFVGPVQFEAFRILCKINGPRSTDLAAHMLCHGNPELRMLAICALRNAGTNKAQALLRLYWTSADLPDRERVMVAIAMARYGDRAGEK